MIRIRNIKQRREAVTAINVFDVKKGIASSQRAKYENPTWFFVLAVLEGRNGEAKSVVDIQDDLKKHGIHIGYQSINRIINVMINKDESIRPHRRNCGVDCYRAVTSFGDIEVIEGAAVGQGRPADLFYLNETNATLKKLKASFKIKIS